MKKIIICACVLMFMTQANAQKFFTKNGKVFFEANSPLEKIEATTNKATGVIDMASGKLEMKLLVKSFHFEKALMEEHFNENYMESDKFPQAVFAGEITDVKSINLQKDGNYNVNLKGKLTMHGVTKDVTSQGVVTVKGNAIVAATSKFKILVADYGIKIPSTVREKIAKEAKIDVNLSGMQAIK